MCAAEPRWKLRGRLANVDTLEPEHADAALLEIRDKVRSHWRSGEPPKGQARSDVRQRSGWSAQASHRGRQASPRSAPAGSKRKPYRCAPETSAICVALARRTPVSPDSRDSDWLKICGNLVNEWLIFRIPAKDPDNALPIGAPSPGNGPTMPTAGKPRVGWSAMPNEVGPHPRPKR